MNARGLPFLHCTAPTLVAEVNGALNTASGKATFSFSCVDPTAHGHEDDETAVEARAGGGGSGACTNLLRSRAAVGDDGKIYHAVGSQIGEGELAASTS